MFLVAVISPEPSCVCLLCSTDRYKPGSLVPWYSVGLSWHSHSQESFHIPRAGIRATCSKACAQRGGLCWEPLGASRGIYG